MEALRVLGTRRLEVQGLQQKQPRIGKERGATTWRQLGIVIVGGLDVFGGFRVVSCSVKPGR